MQTFLEAWERAFVEKRWWVWFTLPAFVIVVIFAWMVFFARLR